MKIKSARKIVLFFILGFALLFCVGRTLSKYSGIFDGGSFLLTVEPEEIDPGHEYLLVYHTFDDAHNDIQYKTEIVYENIPFTVGEVPSKNSDLTFLGWSPQGAWITDEDNISDGNSDWEQTPNIYSYFTRVLKKTGDQATVAELRINYENSSYEDNYEVHLYDIYQNFYIKQVCEPLASAPSNLPYQYDFSTHDPSYQATSGTQPLFCRDYRSSHSINGSYARLLLGSRSITYYVHPGMQYQIETLYYYNTEYPQKDYYYDLYVGDTLHDEGFDYFTEDNITYTIRLRESNNTDPNCVASGTLITMADGSQLPVENIRNGDLVRIYDHENGCYSSSAVVCTEYDGDKEWRVIHLEFSDGTTQRFIYEHGLFDLDLNKYVYITEQNYNEFVGHRFAKESDSGYEIITLINAEIRIEHTGSYSIATEYHLNYFVNGMFSMPGGLTGLFNFFEYDQDLKYEKELMDNDIKSYGLFTYDDFKDYMSEETFNRIFPIKYLKISLAKGLTTFEHLEYIIERYIKRYDL